MSLGISTNPTLEIMNDLKISVTVRTVTRTIDPIYGSESVSYSDATKSYIFFKHSSVLDLTKFSIIDIGDAYVIQPSTDTQLVYGDRIVSDGETFEFTPDCTTVKRYLNGTLLYFFTSLKKVAGA